MITKWNRESLLVTIMGMMILIAIFYYGGQYFIEPVKQEADALTETVQAQEDLLATYPPSEELKASYEDTYLETESYLPLGAQANQELITLEEASDQADVSILSVSRIADQQTIENVPSNFVKNAYEVQMESESPENLRDLIDRLMNEDRVWNITTFTYEKASDNNYTGTITFELPYYNEASTVSPVPSDEMTETVESEEESAE